MLHRSRWPAAPLVLLALAACTAEQRPPSAADASCFGARVLSFQDLVAEVVIPEGERCERGSFVVSFTRGAGTLASLTESREGTVGFIGTADVDGDGRGEYFVATRALDSTARGVLYAYSDASGGIARLRLAPLDSSQLAGYSGHDRFGFGGANQLVRAFPRAAGDTAWFAYEHAQHRWTAIVRPDWVR